MILDVMTQLIEDAGLAVAGRDLFHMSMPATLDDGIIVKTPLAGIAIDNEAPGFFRTNLQAIVRARDYEIGRALAAKVRKALVVEHERVFTTSEGDLRVQWIHSISLPIEYPRQEGNQYEFSLNFRAVYCHAV